MRAVRRRQVTWRRLIFFGECGLATKAHCRIGLEQVAPNSNSRVKHKTLAVVVVATAVLEVLQYTAIELDDVLEPGLLHHRARLLTANPTSTEHHDGFLLQFLR